MLTHFLKERTTVVLNMEWLPVRGSKGNFCNLRSKYQKYDWWVWPVYCILFLCAVLYCAVLCCAVLCCAMLCRGVLCCAVLCCAELCCAALCCALWCCCCCCCVALRFTVFYGTVLQCTALTSVLNKAQHSTNDIVAINIVFSKMQDARYLPLLHLVLSFITSIYLTTLATRCSTCSFEQFMTSSVINKSTDNRKLYAIYKICNHCIFAYLIYNLRCLTRVFYILGSYIY